MKTHSFRYRALVCLIIAGLYGLCQAANVTSNLNSSNNSTNTSNGNSTPATTGVKANDVLAAGVVLRVNNDALTSRQVIFPLREQLKKMIKKAANKEMFAIMVKPLIEKTVMAKLYNLLLYQQAKKQMTKMEIPDQAVDKVVNEEKQKLINRYGGSIAKLQDALAAQGTSLKEVLQDKKQQIIIESYQELIFVPALNITRSQMMSYYRQHKQDEFSNKAIIQFRLIDIKKDMFPNPQQARLKAQKAYKKLKSGHDFAEVARAYSQGYRSKQGGLWDAMDPAAVRKDYQPVVKALQKLDINQTTGIIETDKHFFIAKLIKLQPASTESFASVQFEIRNIIRQRQWKKFSARLSQQLLKTATVGDIGKFITETINFAWLNLTAKP